ncbi:MAG: CDGSH iron-sulfur domain-containing protein [bacterium]
MSNSNDRQYTNGEITVFWKPARCIHATTCFRELLDVYNPRKRPWVNMNGASTEKIIEVTDKCPTQAIYWKFNKDLTETEKAGNYKGQGAEEEVNPETLHEDNGKKEAEASLTIMPNGPVLIEGDFKVIDSDGKEVKTMVMTSFCRCGHSKNQPFCDGTHRVVGFKDE